MQLPIGSESNFKGVVDLLTMKAIYYEDELGKQETYAEIPAELKAAAEEARAFMVEKIAELDDDLTVKFLEGEELTIEELKAGLRKGVIENRATAVFTGSSLKNKGVQQVLDAVIDYLPSPLDIAAVKGTNAAGEEISRPAEDDAPMSALVFKIVTDPYVGRLSYFRVYSGKITTGTAVYNSVKGRKNASAALFVCMPIVVKTFRKCWLAILPPYSD
jgi:elongation factor G